MIKKTKIVLVLAHCFMLGNLLGQNGANGLVPFCTDGLWGYMNADKEVVVEAEYDRTYFFELYLGKSNPPYARVQRNGKFGVINQEGEVIVPIKYDSIAKWSFLTSLGNYGVVYHSGKTRYFSDDGRVKKRYKGTRGWICGGVFTYDLLFSTQTAFHAIDSLNNNNYIYRPLVIEKQDGQLIDHRDTIHVKLDSIISSNLNGTVIMYRNDGKINICQSLENSRGIPLSICMGFRYDEVSFISSNPLGAYERVLKVSEGGNWGLIDLSVNFSKRIRIDYETSWYFLLPKYRQIVEREYDYYLVAYEEGKFGYVKPFDQWDLSAGRRGKVVEYWNVE